VDDFTCQYSDLELDCLREAQPMEAGERVGDAVGSLQVIGQPTAAFSTDWSRWTKQTGRCCHSPTELVQGRPPVSGTCRSALSDGSVATGGGQRNTVKPFAAPGSAS